MLPRYSCLFAEHVFDHLTSSSSPWLSKSDQDELKEAQKRYRSVDYNGDDCSEPNLAHDDMTEDQLAALHRLYRSVCDLLLSNYVPETASLGLLEPCFQTLFPTAFRIVVARCIVLVRVSTPSQA